MPRRRTTSAPSCSSRTSTDSPARPPEALPVPSRTPPTEETNVNGLTPKTGVTDWPPGPPPRAARGAPEPSEPFAGILDAHQARTAPAEGQDRSSRTSEHHRRDDDGPVANDRAESRSNARWARDRRDADGVERERPAKADKASDSKPADSKPAGVQQGDGTAEAPATETPATDPMA